MATYTPGQGNPGPIEWAEGVDAALPDASRLTTGTVADARLPVSAQAATLAATYDPLGTAKAEKIVYVTTSGSDTNDGSTWGKAYATLAAARAALGSSGTIVMGEGNFTLTATLGLDALISLTGQGSMRTTITVNFDGVGIDWKPSTAFSGYPAGTLAGFGVVAGASAANNAVGIKAGSLTKAHFRDVRVSGFTGSNSIGIWLCNQAIGGTGYWTERLDIEAVVVNNNTVGVCFDVAGGTGSFLYAERVSLSVNVAAVPAGSPAQTGVLMRGGAILLGCTVEWVFNVAGTDATNTVAPTAVSLTAGSKIQESLCNIRGEMTSGSAATSLAIDSTSTIQGCTGVLAFLYSFYFQAQINNTIGIVFSGVVRGSNLGGDLLTRTATLLSHQGGRNSLTFAHPILATGTPFFTEATHPSTISGATFTDSDFVVYSEDGTNTYAHQVMRHVPGVGPFLRRWGVSMSHLGGLTTTGVITFSGNVFKQQFASGATAITFDATSLAKLADLGGGVVLVDLYLQQPASGAAATYTWPASVTWVRPFTSSTANAAIDHVRLTSVDGGSTWLGEPV